MRFSVAEVSSVSTVAVQGRALVMVVSRWSASVVAVVLLVSMVAVLGRAVVMAVSRWSASVAAEVSLVSTSLCHSCLCAKKFALLGLMVGASAKKFALHAQNGPQSAFYCVLGELFRGRAAEGAVLGEVFRGTAAERSVPGEFFRAYRHGSHVSHVTWRPTCRKWWGFCTTRSPLAACRRRVGASCRAIPPIGV